MHAKERSKQIVSPRRRHLRGAAFGNFTTLGGFIVWLIAFFTLWIVILLFEADDTPYQWTLKHLQAGEYAIEKIEAFRQENGGKVPDSLIDVSFQKGYHDNKYYIHLQGENINCTFDYIILSDTSYCLCFYDIWGQGQYLSTVGKWNVFCTKYDSESCAWVVDESMGEDSPSVYLFEYEITEYDDNIRVSLDSIVHNNKQLQQQQYMLRFYDNTQSKCGLLGNADTTCCIDFNCILHTYEPSLWTDMDYFRDIQGYVMLDGHICFISNGTQTPWGLPARRTSRGRVFKVTQEEASVGGECYWYLDIDRNYGGTLTVKGFEMEE